MNQPKKVILKNDAREQLKKGIDIVADAVKLTMGPLGRNIMVDTPVGPMIINDGVSIARSIVLKDKVQNMGASVVKEVAEKTNSEAGDGTTTSVVLTQAIINGGLDEVDSGKNVIKVKNGINKGASDVIESLKKMAIPVETDEEILNVASVSAESRELGKVITDAVKEVGADGMITVENSYEKETHFETIKGFKFKKGWISPYMVTNHRREESVYTNVPVLLYRGVLNSIHELIPLIKNELQETHKEGRLVIIAEGIEGDVLATFNANNYKNKFRTLGIQAPGRNEKEKDNFFQDLSVLTGAKVIDPNTGTKLKNLKMKDLGLIKKVISGKKETIIMNDFDQEVMENYVSHILEAKEEGYKNRIAQLEGRIAAIHLSAGSDTEMGYLQLKVEDAIHATQAAIQEGMVPGAGLALMKAATDLKQNKLDDEDEQIGYEIVLKACEAPYNQIQANAANTLKLETAKDIVDPVKVTRTAIQNAASVAGTFLTTSGAITDAEDVV